MLLKSDEKSKVWILALGGSQLGLVVVAGLMLGLWFDNRYGTTPLFGLIGLVSGFSSGILFLVKLVKIARKNEGAQ